MQSIVQIVERTLKKHNIKIPQLTSNLTTNLEFRLLFNVDFSQPFKQAKKTFMRNYLGDLLTLSLGNISIAARKAQIHRRHLHRIINELDIDTNDFRKEIIKPTVYLKENFYSLLETSLTNVTSVAEIKSIYSDLEDISQVLSNSVTDVSFDTAMELFEKEFIAQALIDHEHNVQKTAEAIGISERTLYRKLQKLNLATT